MNYYNITVNDDAPCKSESLNFRQKIASFNNLIIFFLLKPLHIVWIKMCEQR